MECLPLDNRCRTAPSGAGQSLQRIFQAELSDHDFLRLAGAIETACGIKMPLSKKLLLEGRLRSRLRQLELKSFQDYCDMLFRQDPEGEEFGLVLDLVTTNKTEFFRESRHFEYLERTVLPYWLQTLSRAGETYLVWSAGCSSGEEPYTLAMVLSEFAGNNPGFRFAVKATDICSSVLEKGRLGVYGSELAESIPLPLRKKYLLKHRDGKNRVVRIAPEIRQLVQFHRRNLLGEFSNFPQRFHLVFCRNVLIYFDRATQQSVLERLCSRLISGGYLFLGHSETVNGLRLPLANVATTIYRKT